MLGLEIEKLLEGAKKARTNCLKDKFSENPATKSAATIYENNEQGKAIHDLFLYGKDFETIGDWYRQLTAESLGKETKRDGEKIYNGITPITSIGSTDLHSMLQLYLGGPDDKLHSFVWTEKNKQKLSIPEKPEYENLVNDIQNLEMKEIMEAIYKGVNKTFESQERPFNLIELPDKTEKSIGAFMQFKMIEIMYLGALMEVNPFNQPNVEQYKKETHKILKNKEK